MTDLNRQLLDRSAHFRSQPERIQKLLQSSTTRILPIYESRLALSKKKGILYLNAEQAGHWLRPDHSIYLGHLGDSAIFAATFNDRQEAEKWAAIPQREQQFIDSNYYWSDFRRCLFSVAESEHEILLTAAGLYQWHQNHRYCASCGSATHVEQAGHARKCGNESCAKQHFPRIEPAVIFSVERPLGEGKSALLLARQKQWPANRWSVLAGFVEHGETIEQAVVREAREEAGIHVTDIQYFASQPWPFPASLMLAFKSQCKDIDLLLGDDELEQARWFTVEQFIEALRSSEVLPPLQVSLSAQLIRDWFLRQSGYSLDELLQGRP